MKPKVCIFCGANEGSNPRLLQEVERLCDQLTMMNIDLIYGGGQSGLMGLIANRFLSAGKNVIGIRPQKLILDEDLHPDISEMITVEDMFERKAKMMDLSDAFIALPGGVGTLDELLEAITQKKIGYFNKFIGILNTDGYYSGFQTQITAMVDHGFLQSQDAECFHTFDTSQEVAEQLRLYLFKSTV